MKTPGVAFGLLMLLVAALVLMVHRPELKRVDPPAAGTFSEQTVARGARLAVAAGCTGCHTKTDGGPYAGGVPVRAPYGTVWSTNISPDIATGIGGWSEAAFARALREGVGRDGTLLYPAFPYAHFTKLSDEDVHALYAYLMTREPVAEAATGAGPRFPFNIRALNALWKRAFFKDGRFRPVAGQSAAWNRGAYLAAAVARCSACHTPQNRYGALMDDVFGGAGVDGWRAPALDRRNPSPVPWSEEELFNYLRTGVSHVHGHALGPMAPVVRSLEALPDEDIVALAVYFADVATHGEASVGVVDVRPEPSAADGPRARLWRAACAPCHHGPDGDGGGRLAPLGNSSLLWQAEPDNLLQVILHGTTVAEGEKGVVMPGFATLSDADIAGLANWLRESRTGLPPFAADSELARRVRALREGA